MENVSLKLLFIFVLFNNNIMANTSEFIKKYKNIAINEAIRTGIPASITMAQAILESGWGESGLSINANNFFGIKADSSWKGPIYDAATHEVYGNETVYITDAFRKYNNPKQSFKDHSNFLIEMSRYKSLFNHGILDYKSWAHGLKKAGYATSPDYAYKLINLIEQYNLSELDNKAINRKILFDIGIFVVSIIGIIIIIKIVESI